MRPVRRLTCAANAKATTGAGNCAPHDRLACHPNHSHTPNPNPSSSKDAPEEPEGEAHDIGANDGTAIQLRYRATSLDDLTASDVATEPGALAVRAWAEGTGRNWRRDLRRVGRTAHMYADHNAPLALA